MLLDRARRAALLARHGRRWARRTALAPWRFAKRLRQAAPTELVIAPQDIRTADPTRAEDIYAGYYVLGGRMVRAEGRSPFDIQPPAGDWARELLGFAWLRHMRAADTALARANARALVNDFLSAQKARPSAIALAPEVAARRILSWLSQSPLILGGADGDFYRQFMRGLGRDAAIVATRFDSLAGEHRIVGAVALAELALCADLGPAALKRASAVLSEELSRQIFPDGGHVGRNPETLVELLLDLLPLRQTYAARSQPVPQPLLNAIDRIIPMLRLLRHGDGSLALFNGMGVTEPDHVATALAYDDSRGRPLLSAPHAGYQRVEGGNALVIVDNGAPPPPHLSREAHAGTLAFEFSVGLHRIVVNCGAPGPGKPAARAAARLTAAHSTLIIDDMSSSRISQGKGLEWYLGGQIAAAPNVKSARKELPDATEIKAAQDGYARSAGLIHERSLTLARDGARLTGIDRLLAAGGKATGAARSFDLRFHIHPDVAISASSDGTSVALAFGQHAHMIFEAGGAPVSVEESVFFSAPNGTQPTRQLVISGEALPGTEIAWSFTRA